MLKNKTYKQKFLYSSIASGLLLIVIYQFTFSKTFSIAKQCSEMEAKMASVVNAPAKFTQIEQELLQLNASLGQNIEYDGSSHEYLLNIVSEYCNKHKIKLLEFPEQHQYEENKLEIITSNFTVEGEYVVLLKLLFQIETSMVGTVSTVNFYSEKDRKTKRLKLFMKVFIQNIKSR